MTIDEQIDFLQKLKAGTEPADPNKIINIIASLRILRNYYSNGHSEAVIVSMNVSDYKEFQKFQAFRNFEAEQIKKSLESETSETAAQ